MKYAYWLHCVKGCTSRVRKRLFSVCTNAKEVYQLSSTELEKIPGLMHKDVMRIIESKKTWDMERRWQELTQSGVRFVSQEQEEYPIQFRELADAPYGIFYRGSLPVHEEYRVAIAGARMCSEYGRTMARELARELAAHDVAVVSGMARGIDAAGHRGALDMGGRTYAVFGCGVDICYPNYHRQLYYEIAQHGGMLGEYPLGTKPLPAYFPQRNRLVSALSDVVLIIEAKEKSGSLITADFALEQGRDVYALPGRVTDALSYGCNRLIAQGAGVILSVEDCLAELSLQAVRKKEIVSRMETNGNKQEKIVKSTKNYCKSQNVLVENSAANIGYQTSFLDKDGRLEQNWKTGNCEIFDNLQKFSLEKGERLVYGCLGLLPTGFETLLEKTELDIQTLSQILAALMQKHRIEEVYKNHYKIITK